MANLVMEGGDGAGRSRMRRRRAANAVSGPSSSSSSRTTSFSILLLLLVAGAHTVQAQYTGFFENGPAVERDPYYAPIDGGSPLSHYTYEHLKTRSKSPRKDKKPFPKQNKMGGPCSEFRGRLHQMCLENLSNSKSNSSSKGSKGSKGSRKSSKGMKYYRKKKTRAPFEAPFSLPPVTLPPPPPPTVLPYPTPSIVAATVSPSVSAAPVASAPSFRSPTNTFPTVPAIPTPFPTPLIPGGGAGLSTQAPTSSSSSSESSATVAPSARGGPGSGAPVSSPLPSGDGNTTQVPTSLSSNTESGSPVSSLSPSGGGGGSTTPVPSSSNKETGSPTSSPSTSGGGGGGGTTQAPTSSNESGSPATSLSPSGGDTPAPSSAASSGTTNSTMAPSMAGSAGSTSQGSQAGTSAPVPGGGAGLDTPAPTPSSSSGSGATESPSSVASGGATQGPASSNPSNTESGLPVAPMPSNDNGASQMPASGGGGSTQAPTSTSAPSLNIATTAAPSSAASGTTMTPTVTGSAGATGLGTSTGSVPGGGVMERSATPFDVLYGIDAPVPEGTSNEEAIAITQNYLETFLIAQFSGNFGVDVESVSIEVLEEGALESGTGPVVTIAYNVTASFPSDSAFVPETAELDVLLQAAFQPPAVDALLITLQQELPSENPFSQTESVSYSERADLLRSGERGDDYKTVFGLNTRFQPGEVDVKITPFSVFFDTLGGDPSEDHVVQAVLVTLTFLNQYLEMTIETFEPGSYDSLVGAGQPSINDPHLIGFLLGIKTTEGYTLEAPQSDIDMVVASAFSHPFVGNLLDALQSLPETNIFSSTRMVAYRSIPTLDRTATDRDEQNIGSESMSPLLIAGISAIGLLIVAVAALAFLLYRPRSPRKLSTSGELVVSEVSPAEAIFGTVGSTGIIDAEERDNDVSNSLLEIISDGSSGPAVFRDGSLSSGPIGTNEKDFEVLEYDDVARIFLEGRRQRDPLLCGRINEEFVERESPTTLSSAPEATALTRRQQLEP